MKSNLDSAMGDMDRSIKDRLEQSGAIVSSESKRLCPVDTGRLRASITHMREGDVVYIGTNVDYGEYVHNGTRGRAGNPFLTNGLNNSQTALRRIWSG